jgi:osmotically-inducible protein OsmY
LDDEELDDEELDDEELDEELDEDEEDLDEDDDLDDEELGDELEDEDDDDAPPAADERVLEAFSNDPVLAEREIEIEETEPGAILLHGDVHTAREVAHAVTIARGVPGVTGVRQRLRVRDRR